MVDQEMLFQSMQRLHLPPVCEADEVSRLLLRAFIPPGGLIGLTPVNVHGAESYLQMMGGIKTGVAIGLVTAISSMAWNLTWHTRNHMGHFSLYSLLAMLLSTLVATRYWIRSHGTAETLRLVRSAAFVSALVFSASLIAFSWLWFTADVLERGMRQSILKFGVIDFVVMLVMVLVVGYTTAAWRFWLPASNEHD